CSLRSSGCPSALTRGASGCASTRSTCRCSTSSRSARRSKIASASSSTTCTSTSWIRSASSGAATSHRRRRATASRSSRSPSRSSPFRMGAGGGRRRREYPREQALVEQWTSEREETMKVRLIGVLVGVALVGAMATAALGAGHGQAHKAGSIKIGVSLAGYSTDFWSAYVAFEKAAAKKYGVSLVRPISSDGDAGKQATQIRQLIDQGVNALIINPVDSAAIAPTLAYAAAKHVPVVSVDVAPTKGKVYMIVRADNVLYGLNACKYITSHVKGSGHVAMLEGDLASINGLDRKNGFLSCMKSHPNLKVVEYATKWDTPTAVNDAKTALSAYSDLKAIYVHWSGPVPGIIEAEKAAGKFSKVGSP